jgi:hypothetical protein
VRFSLLELAAIVGIGGSVLAVAVPSFGRSLSASKLSEPLDALSRMSRTAVVRAEQHNQPESFPPSVELTPAEVPRGVRVRAPEGSWDHLSWRALDFRFEHEQAFSYKFESSFDPVNGRARFWATAHGDLDGDGTWSTLQTQGERLPGQPARVLPGLFVAREVE